MTKLGMGSAGTMERSHVDRSRDLAFGAEHAGQFLFDGATKQVREGDFRRRR